MIPPSTNNNNTTTNTSTTNTTSTCNNKATLSPSAAKVLQEHQTPPVSPSRRNDEDHDLTSICSSLSSLADLSEISSSSSSGSQELTVEEAPAPAAAVPKLRQKKSRFSISLSSSRFGTASTSTTANNAAAINAARADAVSISFLRPAAGPGEVKQPVKQVIQKALAGLRPGGIFFVLDYRDDKNTTNSSKEVPQPQAQAQASSSSPPSLSPQSCSMAMKELSDDVLDEWNMTMVPTNLELYYNSQLASSSTANNATATNDSSSFNPAPLRSSHLPASQRIVRWMGFKPTTPPLTTTAGPAVGLCQPQQPVLAST